MKIAMVIGGFPLLSQTFIVRQASYLKAHLYTSNFIEENSGLYDLSEIMVKNIGLEKTTTQYRTFETIRSIYARVLGKPFYWWHPKVKNTLLSNLKNGEYQLVVCPFGENAINVVGVCKKLKIPLIVQFLGVDASRYLNDKRYVRSLKGVFEYCRKVVVLSDLLGDNLKAIGCPVQKIIKNNIGVPVSEFETVKMNTRNNFVFTSVGRLVAKKAPIQLISAFERCADENDSVTLNLVGKGPLWEIVKRHVDKSRHSSKIRLLGNKSQSELKLIYGSTNVFVQHSVVDENGDSEGWPVGIAEACASGLPIVATSHSGITDQVVHGKTGYLVKENDVAAMGHYMLKLSRDILLCKDMGTASRKHIEKHGNIEVQVKKLRQILDER